MKKLKHVRWVKENPNLAKGLAAGALLLLLIFVLGLAMGWFSSDGKKTPAVAAAAPPPVQPALPMPPPGKATPLNRPPEPLQAPGEKPQEQPKKEPSDQQQKPPLSDDVAAWKKEDFVRARQQNNPKLLLAIVYWTEKLPGSEPMAQGLTDLLKPLPPEPPPASTPPTTGATPPGPGATPPGAGPMPPRVGRMPPEAAVMPPGPGPMPPGAGPMPPGAGRMPPEAGPMPLNALPRNQADLTKLVETIIAALGDNGSEPARKAIEQILAGTLTTDDDKAAVEAALKALVAHPCAENDALLLRLLTSPEVVRPAEHEGPWPAKDLQARAFELIKTAASGGLRTKLAEMMADRLLRVSAENPIRVLLFASDPLNCGAQMVFYQKEDASKEIRAKLEQQLTGYSAGALARLLKLPDEGQTGGGFSPAGRGFSPAVSEFRPGSRGVSPAIGEFNPRGGRSSPAVGTPEKAEVDLAPQVAGLLWSEKFRALVEPQLSKLRSLERQPDLVVLAATIPQDSTRAALVKLFRNRWNDGPTALEAAGLADRTTTDPGLLVLLKMFPRKNAKAGAGPASAGAPAPRGNRPARPNVVAGGGQAAESLKPAQRKLKAEQDWMDVSTKLVATWRNRFHAAALAKKKAAEEEELTNPSGDATPKLPADFAMNAGAKVIASYHVLWPDEAPAGLSSQKPSLLEIHYIYAEETNVPKKAVGFYARQAQTRSTDARLDSAVWLDSVRVMPETDRRRSIDMLISRSNNQGADARGTNRGVDVRGNNQGADLMKDVSEADLIVEVLTIEIKDPAIRE